MSNTPNHSAWPLLTPRELRASLGAMEEQLTALEADLAAWKARADDLEMEVRQFMWLGHGHFGVYGDDGEMQCSECGTKYGMWDYKRESLEKVRETYLAARFELLSRQQAEARKAESQSLLPGLREALEIVQAERQPAHEKALSYQPTSHDFAHYTLLGWGHAHTLEAAITAIRTEMEAINEQG